MGCHGKHINKQSGVRRNEEINFEKFIIFNLILGRLYP